MRDPLAPLLDPRPGDVTKAPDGTIYRVLGHNCGGFRFAIRWRSGPSFRLCRRPQRGEGGYGMRGRLAPLTDPRPGDETDSYQVVARLWCGYGVQFWDYSQREPALRTKTLPQWQALTKHQGVLHVAAD